jgi:hypothetical protein
MRIDEILLVPEQNFDKKEISKHLLNSKKFADKFPYDPLNFDVNYQNNGKEVIIILTDNDDIVAFAGFSVISASLWQGRNIQVYESYLGRNIAANLIKFVKNDIGVNIQSDIRQSQSGKKLWTEKLQTVGIHPKIFDTETNHIIDKNINPTAYDNSLSKIYTTDPLSPDKFKYTWILEHNDQYPDQNILKENSLLMPLYGLWYDFKKEKDELKSIHPKMIDLYSQ